VVQSVAESLYKLVGGRRGIAKVGHKWGNVGVCWCAWQTDGSAPDEKSVSQRRELARRVYYGAVVEVKKEIPRS
jgi:hypothetical protein